MRDSQTRPPITDLAPEWLQWIGVNGWLFIGAVGALAAVAWFLGATSTIVVPLLLAVMMGVVFAPVVTYLERVRIPRSVGAAIALLLVMLVIGGAIWITLGSIASQWSTISTQVEAGVVRLAVVLKDLHVPQSAIDSTVASIKATLPSFAKGITSVVSSGIGSTISLVLGAFLALYMLYLVLADYPTLLEWTGSHFGLPTELGMGIVEDTVVSLRGYFRGSTIIGIANAAVIALGMWFFHVPLVFPVVIVTIILGYIPFFGALVSGAFAVVIALGANGMTTALWILAVVLVSQNVVQMPISSMVMGDALDLHPIVVLVSTMVGGIFGGLIGSMLGAPLTAIAVRVVGRVRHAAGDLLAEQTAAHAPTGSA